MPTTTSSRKLPKRYEPSSVDEALVTRLQLELKVSRVLAYLLVSRGITTKDAANAFFNPSLDEEWHDPACIPGMDDVADRVVSALQGNERICVFGDFDADGITATATLVRGLRALGGEVVAIIPYRLSEGYGLSSEAAERIIETRPDLVVTVDNGISAGDEVPVLQKAGIDVVVTDHHEPSENVPSGVALADPKIVEDCPSRDLAGVGVALKLVQAVGKRLGSPDLWHDYIDLATLGTIADQMPLLGENRALVTEGVRRMHDEPSAAISAFQAVSTRRGAITAESLSFSLLPRINSAGRIGDPTVALDLLLSDTIDDAMTQMTHLEKANDERRNIETELTKLVTRRIEETYRGQRAIVVGGKGWHDGVKGIVASRIVGQYGVPTILFSIRDGIAHGSGRSVGNVDLFHAVERCSDMFIRFGGHAAAVGITLEADKLEEFGNRLVGVLDELPAEDFIPRCEVDMETSLAEMTLDTIDEVERLAPFGQENPAPRFISRSLFMEDRRHMGKPPVHFACTATDGDVGIRGIYFHPDNLDDLMGCEEAVDIVYAAERNEFRGNVTAQLMIKDIIMPSDSEELSSESISSESEQTEQLVSDLFARSEEFLDRGDYAGILDADSFHTKVAGVTFEGRQDALAQLEVPTGLELIREPDNKYDSAAIAVMAAGVQIGYLNTRLASKLAPAIDGGARYHAVLEERTGDGLEHNLGANILVCKGEAGQDASDVQTMSDALRMEWSDLDTDALSVRLREEFIGDHELHPAQREALDWLDKGSSVLCIMATGRGKSLIFHLHAALVALKQRRVSVFVYPLRALVADQAFHLQDAFSRFGLDVRVLTGESSEEERTSILDGMADGLIDCVLTTPEFLTIHCDRISQTGRVGFLVIDEAHHIAGGHRPAYTDLEWARHVLGDPVVLATTATADDETARAICSVCGIEHVVCDDSVRANLGIADARDAKRRDAQLAHLVGMGGKTVIYVNSREQATRLARMLRKRVPSHAGSVAFYHAGVPKSDRLAIERAFREGVLQAIVSTSAFGEGVNIPDIRNVVLYHLPFNAVEFNQMAGRAGRDGEDALVHLLYGRKDARINEKILTSDAPARKDLVTLYRQLMALAGSQDSRDPFFAVSNSDLALMCSAADSRNSLDERGVSCGLSVFKELGLVDSRGYGSARRLSVVQGANKVELTSSTRYLEGQGELEDFSEFKNWALESSADELLARFNRPILPNRSDLK